MRPSLFDSYDSDYRLTAILCVVVVLLLWAIVVYAEQPECTGDRHYDGVACCPAPSPDTTTTTLPTATAGCPDPAPCPPVICDCSSAGGAFTTVQVLSCPPAPRYRRCRYRADGTMRCPIKDHPGRVFVPEADAH